MQPLIRTALKPERPSTLLPHLLAVFKPFNLEALKAGHEGKAMAADPQRYTSDGDVAASSLSLSPGRPPEAKVRDPKAVVHMQRPLMSPKSGDLWGKLAKTARSLQGPTKDRRVVLSRRFAHFFCSPLSSVLTPSGAVGPWPGDFKRVFTTRI